MMLLGLCMLCGFDFGEMRIDVYIFLYLILGRCLYILERELMVELSKDIIKV